MKKKMKQLFLILAFVLAISCNKITKAQLDELIKPYLEGPSNITSYIPNYKPPLAKYYAGFVTDKEIQAAITKLSLPSKIKDEVVAFLEESEIIETKNDFNSFDVSFDKGTLKIKTVYCFTLSKDLEHPFFIIATFDQATYETGYTTTMVKTCKKRKCSFKPVKIPKQITSEDIKVIEKVIKANVLTQVYGNIMKDL